MLFYNIVILCLWNAAHGYLNKLKRHSVKFKGKEVSKPRIWLFLVITKNKMACEVNILLFSTVNASFIRRNYLFLQIPSSLLFCTYSNLITYLFPLKTPSVYSSFPSLIKAKPRILEFCLGLYSYVAYILFLCICMHMS